MGKTVITTECVVDVPSKLLAKHNVGVIYFNIVTDKGRFQDTTEISETNILEYMASGEKKAMSVEPSAEEYRDFFAQRLGDDNEIIHICISQVISKAVKISTKGKEMLGKDASRVHIVDSKSLSSAMGLLVMKAVEYRDEGLSCSDILKRIDETIPRVSTSFITKNVDYLFYNGRASGKVMRFCKAFSLHPVLEMKNGVLKLRSVYIGNYEKACNKYVKSILKKRKTIDKSQVFITYAGCPHERLERIKKQVETLVNFDEVYLQTTSATVTCNCGPGTLGVLFLREG